MNRIRLLIMVVALTISACSHFKPDAGIYCRITSVRVDARQDAVGHELHVYDYRFDGDSECGDTQVHGTYNVVTHKTLEELQRAEWKSIWGMAVQQGSLEPS